MSEAMMFETRLFINNEYVNATSGSRLSVYNPVNSSVVTSDVQVATKDDIDIAVKAARAAFPLYRHLDPSLKAKMLLKLADLIDEHAQEFARLEALCGGKSVATSVAMELPLTTKILRYYAGWCDKLEGESFPADGGFIKLVTHEPLGVCAAITAFNAPLVFFAFKAGPALATGNTLIVKASEKTPLATLYLGKLIKEAGYPPGVVNFVNGAGSTGDLLASHMDINKISFTGSINIGKKVSAAASASNLKRVTLELGGKAAAIVFPDANLDVATFWCTTGATVNAGQACICTSRVFVHESIKEIFLARMKASFEGLTETFGDPFVPTTTNSSTVDKLQYDKVMKYIHEGKQEGTLLTGGAEPLFEKGLWIKPTIFTDTTPSAKISREEIFGPVLVINSFTDEDDAIIRTNETEFGLSGAVFTQDINRAMRVANKIHSGIVGINCCTLIDTTVPLGGMKQSGSGRELGKYGLRAYTEPKTIFINMTY